MARRILGPVVYLGGAAVSLPGRSGVAHHPRRRDRATAGHADARRREHTTYKPDAEFSNWDTWGRKYTLLGLLAHYELTGDETVLDAARRHADRVLEHFGPGKANIAANGWWTGMAASSILEPMVLLYRQTGDERYLQFAQAIVRSWETPPGPGPGLVRKSLDGVAVFQMFPGPDPKQQGYMNGGSSKAHEMMSCYEGLLELHLL